MDFPFKPDKDEANEYWLMCLDYVRQPSGNRSMAMVFQSRGYDIDVGIKLATKHNWEGRANQYDAFIALLDNKGSLDINKISKLNTARVAKTLSAILGSHALWVKNNQRLLNNSMDTQQQAMKVLEMGSQVNTRVIDALYKIENIDLALNEIEKDLL